MKKLIAAFDEFKRFRFLLAELVKRGIVVKYRRSYLGLLWTLLEPLLSMIVLTFVFGTLLGRGDRTYPVFILSGRLLFHCFSSCTKSGLRSIRKNARMLNKVYVPKYIYTLSSVIYSYVIFLFSLIVLVIVSLVLGVYPTVRTLMIWLPLLLLFLLVLGVGTLLATLGVYFRDMEYLWDVAVLLIMYLSAIFYDPEIFFSTGRGWVLDWNPLFHIIRLFRSCLFGTPMDMHSLLVASLWCVGTLAVGWFFFFKKEKEFILHI